MSIIHEGPSFDVPTEEVVDPSWVDETPANPLAQKMQRPEPRKRRTVDAELRAMKRIAAILDTLEDDGPRERVVVWFSSKYLNH